ncbi:MAG TPA: hypothetical protein VIF02_02815 [Methylocella sp.]|jgi:hypothetical protein
MADLNPRSAVRFRLKVIESAEALAGNAPQPGNAIVIGQSRAEAIAA